MTKQNILFALDITHPGGAPIRPGAAWETREDLLECWEGDMDDLPSMADLEFALDEHHAAQALSAARKVWPTVADFYAEFTAAEKYAIQSSAIPSIVVARGDLAMWRGDVWSDNPDVLAGLNAMVKAKVLTVERRAEILAK